MKCINFWQRRREVRTDPVFRAMGLLVAYSGCWVGVRIIAEWLDAPETFAMEVCEYLADKSYAKVSKDETQCTSTAKGEAIYYDREAKFRL